MNHRVPYEAGNSLTSWSTNSFSRWTALQRVNYLLCANIRLSSVMILSNAVKKSKVEGFDTFDTLFCHTGD